MKIRLLLSIFRNDEFVFQGISEEIEIPDWECLSELIVHDLGIYVKHVAERYYKPDENSKFRGKVDQIITDVQ
ncbi:hypothetical protein KKA15_02385 [Patescibacteria group bacterium]|nr:hypothetical protein [Patescibacteria group bacterium]